MMAEEYKYSRLEDAIFVDEFDLIYNITSSCDEKTKLFTI